MNAQQFQQQVGLAASHLRQGRFAEAEQACRRLLHAAPDHPQVLQLLAVALHRQGRSRQALPPLKKALRQAPGFSALWSSLAEVQRHCGQNQAALESAQRAVSIDGDSPSALFNRGLANRALDQIEPAIRDFERASRLNPGATDIRLALAESLLENHRHAEAFERLDTLAREGALPMAEADLLARAALGANKVEQGRDLLLELNGDTALKACAGMLFQASRWIESLEALERILAADAHDTDARLKRAAALSALARHDEAETAYRELVADQPDFCQAHQNLLVQMHYRYGRDPERLYTEHRHWADRHGHARPRVLTPEAERPRRLAMISPRFTEGPPGRLGLALVEALAERDELEITLYRSAPAADEITERFSRAAPMVDVFDLDDRALARRLRNDRIEVLVDWVGHAPGNRLVALSRRLAPLQLTWLDYFDTTGLVTMDGVVSDSHLSPDDGPQRFTERLYRMPHTRWCYLPRDCPLPRDPPPRDSIRFGSFNRLAKLTDPTVECWAGLLRRLPEARLLLKALDFNSESARQDLTARFSHYGIEPERIELRGFSAYPDLLAQYADMDIALDPYPFTGCLTTCDALWMGVPVISMAQDSLVSRQGLSLLSTIGHPHWVAEDRDDYISRAVELAVAVERGWSRQALRESVAASPLCDRRQFAEDFVAQVEKAWRDRVAASGPSGAADPG